MEDRSQVGLATERDRTSDHGSYFVPAATVAASLRDEYGFEGDLGRIFAGHDGHIVDKWHHYIPIYERYFSRFRGKKVRFLEIGVFKGGSLEMWRKYFGDDAIIYGIDIDPRCAALDGQAGQVRIGSQDDTEFLDRVVDEMGGVDVILDDGSHHMKHIRRSFRALYPKLAVGGVYMVEDLHCAYWKQFGGGTEAPGNFFNHMRRVVDEMHAWYYDPEFRDPEITTGIHVHDSICVFEKGRAIRPRRSQVGG